MPRWVMVGSGEPFVTRIDLPGGPILVAAPSENCDACLGHGDVIGRLRRPIRVRPPDLLQPLFVTVNGARRVQGDGLVSRLPPL